MEAETYRESEWADIARRILMIDLGDRVQANSNKTALWLMRECCVVAFVLLHSMLIAHVYDIFMHSYVDTQ